MRLEFCRLTDDGAEAGTLKDAGDDPDVTHGALLGYTHVRLSAEPGIHFKAGRGVGTVTRPGLVLAVGEPAINPVPRQMISLITLGYWPMNSATTAASKSPSTSRTAKPWR